ncbi:hypothetical protein [Streptomyces lavendulocolor]|uniref:hypothetical protein n=1 Tax=Streptomyces lavendulocolor TaxID=67316 RepID=UPI003C2D0546
MTSANSGGCGWRTTSASNGSCTTRGRRPGGGPRGGRGRALRTPRPRQTVLTHQSVLAGLGNPLADEILWRAGLRPTRRASDLTEAERTPSPLRTFAAHPALRGHRRPDPAARPLAHRPT